MAGLTLRGAFATLILAIVGGIGATTATVVLGLSCDGLSASLYMYLPPLDGVSHNFITGWVERASGEVLQCVSADLESDESHRFSAEFRKAVVARRPRQSAIYTPFRRGVPLPCVQYWWSIDGPHGSHGGVSAPNLRKYPKFKFDALIPWGVTVDVAAWGAVSALLIVSPGLVRRLVRGARGRCLGCGYSLKGLTETRCPECGLEFTERRSARIVASASSGGQHKSQDTGV